jgi:hypothetical protein
MPRSARSQSPGLKIETTVRVSSQATLSTFKPLKRTKIVKAKGRAVFGGGTFGKRGDRHTIGAARLGARRRDLGGCPAQSSAAELASCRQLRVRPPGDRPCGPILCDGGGSLACSTPALPASVYMNQSDRRCQQDWCSCDHRNGFRGCFPFSRGCSWRFERSK